MQLRTLAKTLLVLYWYVLLQTRLISEEKCQNPSLLPSLLTLQVRFLQRIWSKMVGLLWKYNYVCSHVVGLAKNPSPLMIISFLNLKPSHSSDVQVDLYRKDNCCDEFFEDVFQNLKTYTQVLREENEMQMITSKVFVSIRGFLTLVLIQP